MKVLYHTHGVGMATLLFSISIYTKLLKFWKYFSFRSATNWPKLDTKKHKIWCKPLRLNGACDQRQTSPLKIII